MTYCLSLLCRAGIIFLSDTRTSAGVDDVRTHPKMRIYDRQKDRFICILSAGNLSITQTALALIDEDLDRGTDGHLLNQPSLFCVARYVGDVVRRVAAADRAALQADGFSFNCNLIVGGQIEAQAPEIYHVYPQGNVVHASESAPFLQVGESKYGKPILDRLFNFETGLSDAVKLALLSLDATLRSNVSVGPPIDVLCYRKDSLQGKIVRIEEGDVYWQDVRQKWHSGLVELVSSIPAPGWSCE